MSDEHKLTFESDDYYGPTMKLVVDCSSSVVVFRQEANTTGVTASLDYTLHIEDQVLKVVGQLLDWLEREKARKGG
jgi:hypothetical protein